MIRNDGSQNDKKANLLKNNSNEMNEKMDF